ncbi:MAG: CdaR family protein [Bacilli bacterium]
MRKFLQKLYSIIDKFIVTPISRCVYFLSKKMKKNQGRLDKILNKPNFLIYMSLVLAVGMFLLIDSKVISLVETEAEVITNVPVIVKYNKEAFVIEGVPETVDITITGRKSDIYLAKQLGEYEVILDLSDYLPDSKPYKVYFTYSKSIDSLTYKLDPSYVQVTIKNKESSVFSLSHDLLNIDKLDNKLNVKGVNLNKSEVVVKGSTDALANIATVKALIDLNKEKFKEAGTYDIDNIELVAYDSKGLKLNNIEIVPKTTSATIVLDSYSVTVPLSIETTGKLVAGKSIASILINGNSSYSLTIYGEKASIDKITSVPVTINVDGLGTDGTKTYNVTITKPNGVREMSSKSVTITATFGEEQQKTIEIGNNITKKNLATGLNVNILPNQKVSVQVKGVASVIDKITIEDINAYVDLSGLGVGEREVEIKIDSNNPLVTFVVTSQLKIKITNG